MKRAFEPDETAETSPFSKRARIEEDWGSEGPFASLLDELIQVIALAYCDIRSHANLAAASKRVRTLTWTHRHQVDLFFQSRRADAYYRFSAEEVDVPTLFGVDPIAFHQALSQTRLARQVRPWLTGCSDDALQRGFSIAGGAARAAILEALRTLRVRGGIAKELTTEYGDVDLWVDLNYLDNPYAFVSHVAGGEPVLECGYTCLSTRAQQLQICAWDSAIGHKADCPGYHSTGTTPIGCFDASAVQFALIGRWFEEGGNGAVEATALCTRLAAYSLVTRHCYLLGSCPAQYWPFDGKPMSTQGIVTVHANKVWSSRRHRHLLRALKFTKRGHLVMEHVAACHVHATVPRRRFIKEQWVVHDATASSSSPTLMDLERAQWAVDLPDNPKKVVPRPIIVDAIEEEDGYRTILTERALDHWETMRMQLKR
jgi:hypothetical protein